MSQRFNNGSHYENHPRAEELHEGAAHAHLTGEQHGKQEHLTGHEHSRQELEHDPKPHQQTQAFTFGHKEIAARAHEIWQRRGEGPGSTDEDWFLAVEELRSQALGH